MGPSFPCTDHVKTLYCLCLQVLMNILKFLLLCDFQFMVITKVSAYRKTNKCIIFANLLYIMINLGSRISSLTMYGVWFLIVLNKYEGIGQTLTKKANFSARFGKECSAWHLPLPFNPVLSIPEVVSNVGFFFLGPSSTSPRAFWN